MTVHIVARHIKLTKPLKDFIQEKVEKIQKHFDNIVWAQVILGVEKKVHSAEIIIHASQQTMTSSADGGDLYAAVDIAMDKINAQVRKYKERLKQHRPSEAEYARVMEMSAPDESARFSVIKQVSIKPMTRDAAVTEMEKLGYIFWMFTDNSTKQVNVVFKRLDDTYGLLQPVKKNVNA